MIPRQHACSLSFIPAANRPLNPARGPDPGGKRCKSIFSIFWALETYLMATYFVFFVSPKATFGPTGPPLATPLYHPNFLQRSCATVQIPLKAFKGNGCLVSFDFWPRKYGEVRHFDIVIRNVCPSICPSHSWVKAKWFKISKYTLHHTP